MGKYLVVLIMLSGCGGFVTCPNPTYVNVYLHPEYVGKCFKIKGYPKILLEVTSIDDRGYRYSYLSENCDIIYKNVCIISRGDGGWAEANFFKSTQNIYGDAIDCGYLRKVK